ncbi:phosphatidylserine decarboxylase [Streptomyces roseoverticillatus]|uniref:phosphatidylserine decarboxylase n=1 Tax=Streptomyces roseoverticillatus TaxID=66429 RepID=UPI001F45E5B3|nr:phosphatidylserine decarboxylase [Streptomyces roseoverticillatus]MCF3106158.1 phosphatidylserine decarboxylase [Streptomyces roseoverticillatus]
MPQGQEEFSTSIDGFIEKIRIWYADKKEFRDQYDAAVNGAKPCPLPPHDNGYCDWQNKPIDFLCQFFWDWYQWQEQRSGVDNGLTFIERFSWINYDNRAGMDFVANPGPGRDLIADFTNLQGLQMDAPESKEAIKRWVRQLGPKRMDDYKIEDWENFNEFFIREIKEGRRPVDAKDDPTVVVAPADCVINMIVDDLKADTPIPVKTATATMNLRTLLDGSEYAERFVGGTAVSCILMPDSYHWYHAPVAGRVVAARDDIGGPYYGIRNFPQLLDKGDVGYGYDYKDFQDFRRGYVIIKTVYVDADGGPDGEGYVAQIPVGLNSIASVNFLPKFKGPFLEPVPVEKGERIGNFQYGGSLNILLFEKGRFPAVQLLQGQRIGVLEDPAKSATRFPRAPHTQLRTPPPNGR